MFLLPALGALPIGAMGLLGSAPPVLSLDFKAALDSRITFTRGSTAAYTNSSGVLAYAAVDAPRLDYEPNSHVLLGTLFEGATTNLTTASEDLNNAAWAKTATTVSSNTSTAPDGATTADRLVETTATSAHSDSTVSVTPTNGNVYTASFWAKAGERSLLQWVFGGGPFGTNAWVCFDLSNGTILFQGSAITFASITAYGGMYYCRATAIATATSASRNVLSLANNSTNGALRSPSYTGSSTMGLSVWGVQFELGPPSSYVPTTSTAASRALDLAVMTGTNFSSWWPSASGSLVIKVRPGVLGGTNPVWEASDGTIDRRITIYIQNGTVGLFVFDAAATQVLMTTGALTSGVECVITMTYANNNFSLSVDGGTPVTDTAASVPAVTQCRFGSDSFSSGLNGQLVEFKAYA